MPVVNVRKHYSKPNDLSWLHHEIIAAGVRPHRVQGLNNDIWVTSDSQHFSIIDRVVMDHDPIARPRPRREMSAGEFIDMLMENMEIFQKPSTIGRFRNLLRLN